ncbi:hypothetical protein ABK040_002354 [Willaertia magna]
MSQNRILLNLIFKRNEIILKNQIPIYFNNLNYLIIKRCDEVSLEFLKHFINLKSLKLVNSSFFRNENFCNNLTNLEELYVEKVDLNGIECLKNLNTLTVNNGIISKDNLINLQNLTKLSLQNLTVLPAFFQYVSELKKLNILYLNTIHCKNSENYLKNLQNLTELKIVGRTYLYFNSFLTNLTNLIKLECDEDNVTDDILKYLKNLKSLILNTGWRHGIDGTCFKDLKNLEYIKGGLNYLKEENLQYLDNLTYLSGPSLNGNCFSFLTKLKRLQFFTNKQFDDFNLQYLSSLSSLTVLGNNFNGKYLFKLNNLTKLNIVDVDCNVKEKYLFKLINLKNLKLNIQNTIKGKTLLNLKNLEKLDIFNNSVYYHFNKIEIQKIKRNINENNKEDLLTMYNIKNLFIYKFQ